MSLLVLKDHIAGCVATAIKDRPDDPRVKELIDVIRKVIRR